MIIQRLIILAVFVVCNVPYAVVEWILGHFDHGSLPQRLCRLACLTPAGAALFVLLLLAVVVIITYIYHARVLHVCTLYYLHVSQ